MSFMYNPHPYDDPQAVNKIKADQEIISGITSGAISCGKRLASAVAELIKKKSRVIIGLDGYISAPLAETAGLIGIQCAALGVASLPLKGDIFKDEETLKQELTEYLPEDRTTDPPLLYGKVYHGGYEDLINLEKLAALEKKIRDFQKEGSGVLIVYSNGGLMDKLKPLYDLTIFIDLTPKRAVMNLKAGKYGNLGTEKRNTGNQTLRRSYYVDFEAAGALRGKLLREKAVD